MGHRRILCLGEGSVLLIVLCGSLCAVQRRARQHAAGRRCHGSSLTGTRNCWWPPAAGFRIGPALRAAESSGPGSCIPSDTSRRLYFALYSVNAPRPASHFLSHLSLQLGFRLTSRVTAVGVQAAAKRCFFLWPSQSLSFALLRHQRRHVRSPAVLCSGCRCQLYPRRSQQQEPVVDFQEELRQAFLAETPRGG